MTGRVTDALTIYAGLVQGVEEREAPPLIAVNRLSASAALSSRQYEAGIKWMAGDLTFIGGYFKISKPYYDLDDDDVYTRRGTERHEGVEASLSGDIGPMSLVAGASIYTVVVRDRDGKTRRPEGVAGTRGVLSLDYSLIADRLFLEGEVTYGGGAQINDSGLRAPGALDVTIGARLVSGRYGTLRVVVANAADRRGWIADRSGGLSPRLPRSFGVSYVRDVVR